MECSGIIAIEEPILGQAYVKKETYDLMEVVILNLGVAEDEAECGVLNLLKDTFFSCSVTG